MLETIFQRKHLPDHKDCLILWSLNHAEIIDRKVLLKGIKHSINVSPYYFLLFLLLHKGWYFMYHTLFPTHSRAFWSSHWNCPQSFDPVALSIQHTFLRLDELEQSSTRVFPKRKRCCLLVGMDLAIIQESPCFYAISCDQMTCCSLGR